MLIPGAGIIMNGRTMERVLFFPARPHSSDHAHRETRISFPRVRRRRIVLHFAQVKIIAGLWFGRHLSHVASCDRVDVLRGVHPAREESSGCWLGMDSARTEVRWLSYMKHSEFVFTQGEYVCKEGSNICCMQMWRIRHGWNMLFSMKLNSFSCLWLEHLHNSWCNIQCTYP